MHAFAACVENSKYQTFLSSRRVRIVKQPQVKWNRWEVIEIILKIIQLPC